MPWKWTSQAKCPSKPESEAPGRQPDVSMILPTCKMGYSQTAKLAPARKAFTGRYALKKPKGYVPQSWALTLVKIRTYPIWSRSETVSQGNMRKRAVLVIFLSKKKNRSCPWVMKPVSADVISSIDFSRSSTSHNSSQCHRGPSTLQIGLINARLLYAVSASWPANVLYRITETNHLLDIFNKYNNTQGSLIKNK